MRRLRDVHLPHLHGAWRGTLPPVLGRDRARIATVPAAITHAALAPVLAEASVRAEQVTQLVLGETAAVLKRSGEWRRVRTHADAYEGWVHAGYLSETGDAEADAWRARATGWCEGAVIEVEDRRIALPLRARLAIEDGAVLLPDGRQGRVAEGAVRERGEAVASALGRPPERWALERFLGSPYQWGGVTPWGVDCSGLVQTVFAARGVPLPRDSGQQVLEGAAVELDAIRPGDLLFFAGDSGRIDHVALMGEGDTLVHSTIACGGMLAEPWRPGARAACLRERLAAARRLEAR